MDISFVGPDPFSSPPIDVHVASNLLRNAIRRGESELAVEAALQLLRLRGADLWRRLLVIAFEDVGVGSIQALVQTTAACTDPISRLKLGGEARAACFLARLLAQAPKDLSGGFLLDVALRHPAYDEAREKIDGASLVESLDLVADHDLPLPTRAIAAWRRSGSQHDECQIGNLAAILTKLGRLGAPPQLTCASAVAALRFEEPIFVLISLLWLEVNSDQNASIAAGIVPEAPTLEGVPLNAFDRRTAIGRAAFIDWREKAKLFATY